MLPLGMSLLTTQVINHRRTLPLTHHPISSQEAVWEASLSSIPAFPAAKPSAGNGGRAHICLRKDLYMSMVAMGDEGGAGGCVSGLLLTGEELPVCELLLSRLRLLELLKQAAVICTASLNNPE